MIFDKFLLYGIYVVIATNFDVICKYMIFILLVSDVSILFEYIFLTYSYICGKECFTTDIQRIFYDKAVKKEESVIMWKLLVYLSAKLYPAPISYGAFVLSKR